MTWAALVEKFTTQLFYAQSLTLFLTLILSPTLTLLLTLSLTRRWWSWPEGWLRLTERKTVGWWTSPPEPVSRWILPPRQLGWWGCPHGEDIVILAWVIYSDFLVYINNSNPNPHVFDTRDTKIVLSIWCYYSAVVWWVVMVPSWNELWEVTIFGC